eukprot:XP_012810408.1 PREDICTED: prolyl 3-hydroxylase 1-like [Xenopus tropicalis]
MIRINIAQAVDEQSKCPWSPKMASVVPCNVTEAQGAVHGLLHDPVSVVLVNKHRYPLVKSLLCCFQLGQEGKVPLSSALLCYNVTDKVRRVVESYFRLDSPLYFSYSHLVCRTAVEEKQEGRKDLSHPVHVDNCILNTEANMCIKEHPAYTFRDYSAILYLNGDFEGGNFVFTELDAKTITVSIFLLPV